MTNDALTAAVQSMQNDLRTMDSLSQNMVNIATPGYKRAIPVMQAFGAAMRAAEPGAPQAGAVPALSSVVDLGNGPVKQTGRPFDVAINGDGYFELATPEGMAYTRAGNFRLDAGARLVSEQGFAVQGTGGEIVVNGAGATIDHAGRIERDGHTLGQLKIVRFTGPMVKTGSGLLQAGAPGTEAVHTPELQVGYLEGSNVAVMREMVAMMETARHFESAQKLFQGYDDVLGNAIQKLGQF